ncbi:MAG: serine hydrolase [Deltaproteobacteria bacterium]|nr:serine hydrolase [Deltaproteobacteria bacterium]
MRVLENPESVRLKKLISEGAGAGIYPGAVLLAAWKGKIVFFEAAGYQSTRPRKLPMKRDTIFDLASLTKPLATALAMMSLVDRRQLDLDRPLGGILSFGGLGEKGSITPRQLLSHCSGLPAWRPFYLHLVHFLPDVRKRLLREQILGLPLEYPPGTRAVYSDPGFMLLEWVVEEAAGEALPTFLERHFYGPLGLRRTFLGGFPQAPEGVGLEDIAPTEECPWRRKILRGEVHDENAYALGGYSGHAGLFGTAEEVYVLLDMLRGHYLGVRKDFFEPETVRLFFERQETEKGNTWALGWDTPSTEHSSAGGLFSKKSVGHLGFTGTSVWMDLEKDVIVVFLTNRIHPSRKNEKIREFRPVIHNAVMEALGQN